VVVGLRNLAGDFLLWDGRRMRIMTQHSTALESFDLPQLHMVYRYFRADRASLTWRRRFECTRDGQLYARAGSLGTYAKIGLMPQMNAMHGAEPPSGNSYLRTISHIDEPFRSVRGLRHTSRTYRATPQATLDRTLADEKTSSARHAMRC
jgi:hypothetical protein